MEPRMADEVDDGDLPKAAVTRRKRLRISIIWIIPALAALVAIGIAIQRLRAEGPTITIVFRAAEGIEAGKTFIKYKDVNIGQVTNVQLTQDFSKVEVTARLCTPTGVKLTRTPRRAKADYAVARRWRWGDAVSDER